VSMLDFARLCSTMIKAVKPVSRKKKLSRPI
jgi:hypothetical protein